MPDAPGRLESRRSYEYQKELVTSLLVLTMLTSAALADQVTVDYNHSANFGNYHTYSRENVKTANSIWDARVRQSIDRQLAAKGWTQSLPAGTSPW